MTLAGLNTINLSQLNTFQQVILFVLILLGSAIWVSIAVVHVRRKAFERKFKSLIERARQRRRDRSNSASRRSSHGSIGYRRPEVDGVVVRGRAIKSEEKCPPGEGDESLPCTIANGTSQVNSTTPVDQSAEHDTLSETLEANDIGIGSSQAKQPMAIDSGVTRRITFAPPQSPVRERQHGRILSMQGIGARQNIQNHPLKTPPPVYPDQFLGPNEENELMPWPSFLSGEFAGRNSQFAGLTLAERERLGGVEYRAVSVLAVLVPAYFILWQMIGCIGLGAYVAYNRADVTAVNAENPWYELLSLSLYSTFFDLFFLGGLVHSMGCRLSTIVA